MTFLVDGTNGGTFPSWTTATRPASPAVGQMGYNTTTGLFDQYTASGWSSVGAAPGNVIQVVQGSTSTTTATSSSAYIASGLSGTITPKFSTSKIFVILSCQARSPNLSWLQVALFKNGSQLVQISPGLHYRITGSSDVTTQLNYSYLDSPATTSATTYALYFDVQGGGTGSINPDGSPMTIILMEVAA